MGVKIKMARRNRINVCPKYPAAVHAMPRGEEI
jgi:hypothetical protein